MQPGQVALIPVTFIEDRAGRALVRLPNGSKTSIQYDALDERSLFAHFLPAEVGTGVTAWCQARECDWHQQAEDWATALHRLADHFDLTHRPT